MAKKIFFILLFLIFLLTSAVLSTNSANAVFHENFVTQGTQEVNIPNILLRVQGIFFGALILLAGVFILASAYFYLFSVGEPQKTGKARLMITYAIVAIIVAALSQGIVFIVEQLVGIEGAPSALPSAPWGKVGITPTPLPPSEWDL